MEAAGQKRAPKALIGSLILVASDAAQDYARRARAANTLDADQSDWRHYMRWCAELSAMALPSDPQTVANYIADLAPTHRASALRWRLTSISQAHHAKGHPTPTTDACVVATWRGIRNTYGTTQRSMTPVVTSDIRSIVAALPTGMIGLRDRALLLQGYAAAVRVSERIIARQTGHRSKTVLRRYIHDGDLFTDNAAAAVGL